MLCNYAGCDCIIPDQVENGCKDCELKLDNYFRSIIDRIEFCALYLRSNTLSPDTAARLERVKAEVVQMKEEYFAAHYGARE